MKSKLISATVLAAAALTSMGASAEVFNSWVFEQMAAPATRTRAEVKAEVLQAQNDQRGASSAASASAYNGAVAQQNLNAAPAEKTGAAPQATAGFVKTSQ
jgi:hypothetical protein